jgi:hypothetical protein
MTTDTGEGMAEKIHISEMLDISDEDAAEVIKDIAVSVAAHHLMSEVLGELAAKYDKKAILAGMMMTKTFDLNEREINEHKYDFGQG